MWRVARTGNMSSNNNGFADNFRIPTYISTYNRASDVAGAYVCMYHMC